MYGSYSFCCSVVLKGSSSHIINSFLLLFSVNDSLEDMGFFLLEGKEDSEPVLVP